MNDVLNKTLTKRPIRNLPFTGIPVSDIRDYTVLESRIPAERDLANFITDITDTNRVNVCVVKAWWGEGKTDAYENFLQPLFNKKNIPSENIIATTVARIFERRESNNLTDPVPHVAFLACVFEAIWEEGITQDKFDIQRKENETDKKYVNRVLNNIKLKKTKLVIFIDEVEQLEPRTSREDIFSGLRGAIDDNKQQIKGLIQFILACTPDAWVRLAQSSIQMGGLLQRLRIVDLPTPQEDESLSYVFGLLNYLYEKKLPDPHPFKSMGIVYAIIYAAHRNPRCMIKTLQQIINTSIYTVSGDLNDSIFQIDSELVIKSLSDFNLPLFGTDVPAFDSDLYDKISESIIIKDDDRTGYMEKICEMLCGEPYIHNIGDLKNELNVSDRRLSNYINTINLRVKQKGLLNGDMILPFSSIKHSIDKIPEDLILYLRKKIVSMDNIDDVRYVAPSDRKSFVQIFPEISGSLASSIFNRLSRLYTKNQYLMISDELLQRLYPSPEFIELDFLNDKSKRLPIWKNAFELLSERESNSKIENILILALQEINTLED